MYHYGTSTDYYHIHVVYTDGIFHDSTCKKQERFYLLDTL